MPIETGSEPDVHSELCSSQDVVSPDVCPEAEEPVAGAVEDRGGKSSGVNKLEGSVVLVDSTDDCDETAGACRVAG